jgi:hypothetical protein
MRADQSPEFERRIYDACLADIEQVESCFDPYGQCSDETKAQEQMAELKAKWKRIVVELHGTPAARVVKEALCRIRVRSNSRPNAKWLSQLYSARIDLVSSLRG